MQPRSINGHPKTRLCRALFHSGGTCNLMGRVRFRVIPKGCPVYELEETSPTIGIGGSVHLKKYHSILPEFGQKHTVENIIAFVHCGEV